MHILAEKEESNPDNEAKPDKPGNQSLQPLELPIEVEHIGEMLTGQEGKHGQVLHNERHEEEEPEGVDADVAADLVAEEQVEQSVES